jgi:hypothetical protein
VANGYWPPQDITFPNLACSLITLDTSEVSGERQMDVHDGHLLKRRLNKEVCYLS